MSRQYCCQCQRPEKACICHLMTDVDNVPHVVVLQHPSEVGQTKGTLPLLAGSLKSCTVLVGEDFSEHEGLNELLERYRDNIYLLYPSEDALELGSGECPARQTAPGQRCIILLDGTWKKAYRMYMLSNVLHQIPHLCLPGDLTGRYQIRKTAKKNALSTLEACCYALGIMEQKPQKYRDLLEQFVKFNQFQLSFHPGRTEPGTSARQQEHE
ncbi:tRNA-uridine aminocarboxypropyltransferase [Thalassomonas actiniarum]|uniref:tRNA-uridine aminocarboxypropyltransferase n=1 Tax=Thalassomonas actiniarum TaxID=485447 RepID=A0AAF0C5M6_9GAMM|nr:tRNA-uridine aminocarboxypropyltransferase [Thalassomonas actiniarum]WDE01050.1 DTW domain-containing protein [Thalassomonas actiniarum]